MHCVKNKRWTGHSVYTGHHSCRILRASLFRTLLKYQETNFFIILSMKSCMYFMSLTILKLPIEKKLENLITFSWYIKISNFDILEYLKNQPTFSNFFREIVLGLYDRLRGTKFSIAIQVKQWWIWLCKKCPSVTSVRDADFSQLIS